MLFRGQFQCDSSGDYKQPRTSGPGLAQGLCQCTEYPVQVRQAITKKSLLPGRETSVPIQPAAKGVARSLRPNALRQVRIHSEVAGETLNPGCPDAPQFTLVNPGKRGDDLSTGSRNR